MKMITNNYGFILRLILTTILYLVCSVQVLSQQEKANNNYSSIGLQGGYFQNHLGGGISYFRNDWGIEVVFGKKDRESIFQNGDASTFRGEVNLIYKKVDSNFFVGLGYISWSGSITDYYGKLQTDRTKGFSMFFGLESTYKSFGIGGKLGYQSIGNLEYVIVDRFQSDYVSMGEAKEIMKESNWFYHLYVVLRF